jgi:hypothetical protein
MENSSGPFWDLDWYRILPYSFIFVFWDFLYLFVLVCFLVGGGGALCFCDRVPGWPGTYYEDQAGFKLMNLLTQSPECWDYKCMPPYPALFLLL